MAFISLKDVLQHSVSFLAQCDSLYSVMLSFTAAFLYTHAHAHHPTPQYSWHIHYKRGIVLKPSVVQGTILKSWLEDNINLHKSANKNMLYIHISGHAKISMHKFKGH